MLSYIVCLRDEKSTFSKQQKIYIYTVSLCFLSYDIGPNLPHLFRQEFPSIYLHNVYHKALYISLHSLPISRQKWKTPSCFQLHCAMVAWNHFFILVFASAVASARKWNFFHTLSWHLHLCLYMHWCSSPMYFLYLHLHLHLCRMCEQDLSIKILEFKLHEELKITW